MRTNIAIALVLSILCINDAWTGSSTFLYTNVLKGKSELTLVNMGASILLPTSPGKLATLVGSEIFGNKSIDGGSNTLTNIPNSALSTIARSKIAAGTANRIVLNDGSGLLSELALSSTQFAMGNGSSVPSAATASSAFTFGNTGIATLAAQGISNSHIAQSANIQRSKIDKGTAFFTLINGSDGRMSEVSTGGASTVLMSNPGGAPSYQALPGGITVPVVVSSGGTGLTTLTSNNILIGNGIGNVTFVAPGTNGQALLSNGTSWGASTVAGIQMLTFELAFGNADETAGNCTLSPCVIYRQRDSDGTTNTVTQVTRASTGVYNVAIASGRCSQPPSCGSTTALNLRDITIGNTPTTTNVQIATYGLAGSAGDAQVDLVCACPR